MSNTGTPVVEEPAVAGTEAVNILIVDDEPANLLVLETVLADPGYRLVRANSGEEALLALMAGDFAVLVLDIRMPGMTGFELAKLVKERKRTARIPIIFLTAYYGEDQHVLAGYGSGAVDYLHKPVEPAVLQTKVSVFAELHRKGLALEAANRALQAEITERRRAEARLSELNETLDRRVTERTIELQRSEAQLLDAHRRKDEFLATLAHELRNPLAPVHNAVQLLRIKDLDPKLLASASAIIDRQVRNMSRLIDDLMDLSRITHGRIELRRRRVDVKAVLRDAIETARPLIDDSGHELILDEPADALVVLADPARLAQAFMNLLNNAAKYMERDGRIEVSVRCERDGGGGTGESGAGGHVTVHFKDQGIGIAPERLSGVFVMFSQIETALSRSRGGLGIGLALTQRLVELHGGSVSAHSAGIGKGSEFRVRLPLAADAAVVDAGPAPPVAPAPPAAALKILVADDNHDAATSLTLLLQQHGHTVRRVGDGAAALRAAAEFGPRLALLDIGMPELNGYDACAAIRRLPGGEAMTIVAITGWGQPADALKAKAHGFDRHLVKPVEPAALLDLIARLEPRQRP